MHRRRFIGRSETGHLSVNALEARLVDSDRDALSTS